MTSPAGVTVQATPIEPCEGLYVESFDNETIVVRELAGGASNAAFHYLVNGVRKGHEAYEPITDSPKIMEAIEEAGAKEGR